MSRGQAWQLDDTHESLIFFFSFVISEGTSFLECHKKFGIVHRVHDQGDDWHATHVAHDQGPEVLFTILSVL